MDIQGLFMNDQHCMSDIPNYILMNFHLSANLWFDEGDRFQNTHPIKTNLA